MRKFFYCGIFALFFGMGLILIGLLCPVNGDYPLLDQNWDASSFSIVGATTSPEPLKIGSLSGDNQKAPPVETAKPAPQPTGQVQQSDVNAPVAQQVSADSLEGLTIPDIFLEKENKKPSIPELPGIDAFQENSAPESTPESAPVEAQGGIVDSSAPAVPEFQTDLSTPETPAAAAAPDVLTVPAAPESPSTPELPMLPDLSPADSASPAIPQAPELPDVPAELPAPALPSLPNESPQQIPAEPQPTFGIQVNQPVSLPETANALAIAPQPVPPGQTVDNTINYKNSNTIENTIDNTTDNSYSQTLSSDLIPADLREVGNSLTLPAPGQESPAPTTQTNPNQSATAVPSVQTPSMSSQSLGTVEAPMALVPPALEDGGAASPETSGLSAGLAQPDQQSLASGASESKDAEPTHSNQIVKNASTLPAPALPSVNQFTGNQTPPAPQSVSPIPGKNEPIKEDEEPMLPKIRVQTASFDKITPGVSTLEIVSARWGKPTNKVTEGQMLVYQYVRKPSDNIAEIQVIFQGDKLTSLIAQFRSPIAAADLEKRLNLSEIIPVLVSNPEGIILGQAYPERGISFAFVESKRPGKSSLQVDRLILEPVQAEPFVLRAETLLVQSPLQAEFDLKQALSRNDKHAHANWLYARLLASNGNLELALKHAQTAVELDSKQPRYLITVAQIMGQTGQTDKAIEIAQQAIDLTSSENNEKTYLDHLCARSWRLKGDLIASQETPDYAQALECHTKAISLADSASRSDKTAVSTTALEVLIDAHLGAAHDIAWGNWNQKAVSVTRWLDQAHRFTNQMIKSRPMSEREQNEQRLRVAMRSLSACAGVGRDIDPTNWVNQVVQYGDSLIALTESSARQDRISWDVGMSVYDAVQIYQARQDEQQTLAYGQKAIQYMESALRSPQALTATDYYILGRLYFRLGAIYAINHNDHQQAVVWYKKSLPMFEKMTDDIQRIELGRLGETLVSMGVSFWEVKMSKQAVNLTESGIMCLEQAVQEGLASSESLEIPYRNLSMMLDNSGKKDRSREYLEKADAIQKTIR